MNRDYAMKILGKRLVIDILKILSRVGIIFLIASVTVIIQFFRSSYGFIDVLFILAVGMILGAVYLEGTRKISDYLERISTPEPKKVSATSNPFAVMARNAFSKQENEEKT
jgi:hypothetical protein